MLENVKTVGDLKKLIQDLDDDIQIVSLTKNTMELGREYVLGASISIEKLNRETISCFDSFDGYSYRTDVYRKDDNGDVCLKIE